MIHRWFWMIEDDVEMYKDDPLLIKVDGRLFNLVRRSCFVNSR